MGATAKSATLSDAEKKRKLFFIPLGVPRGIRNCLYWSCFGKYEFERELREFVFCLLPVAKVGGASLVRRENSRNSHGSLGAAEEWRESKSFLPN